MGWHYAVYRICRYWLDLGNIIPVRAFAEKWFSHAMQGKRLLPRALHRLALARYFHYSTSHALAEEYFNQSIMDLHISSRYDQLMVGLLYRADFLLNVAKLECARTDCRFRKFWPLSFRKFWPVLKEARHANRLDPSLDN
jgi:hypothetical protein